MPIELTHLLPQPQCPSYGASIPSHRLRLFSERHSSTSAPLGIQCYQCRAILKADRRFMFTAVAVIAALTAAIPFAAAAIPYQHLQLPLGGSLCVVVLSAGFLLPTRFVRFSVAGHGERIELLWHFFEEPEIQAIRREENEEIAPLVEWVAARPDDTSPLWACASCGSENPNTFEVCWKCRRPRIVDKR